MALNVVYNTSSPTGYACADCGHPIFQNEMWNDDYWACGHPVQIVFEELLPCPFCGKEQADMVGIFKLRSPKMGDAKTYPEQRDYRVVCRACGAQGPRARNVDLQSRPEAAEGWNKRKAEKTDGKA
jgi:Lar family restriction alleviation protein